jgi:hypothetical protein
MAEGSRSAHILRMPGISSKDLPGLIYHQRVQSNDFLAQGSDQDEFFAKRSREFRSEAVLAKNAANACAD